MILFKKGMACLLCVFLVVPLFTGCASEDDKHKYPASFFYRDYEADTAYVPAYSASGAETDHGSVSSIEFLYEDIVFEDKDIIPAGSYDFTCTSAACYDIEHTAMLFSKDIFEKVYPASTTKLLTALIAVKYLDLDSVITIEEDNCGITTWGAQLCGFLAGDELTVRDMLYCLLIYSGNDAALALALSVSGSEKEFVKLINSEAKRIGAIDTHFTNPHGLHDPDHYTTAYDIYLIFNECLKDPFLKQIFTTRSYTASVTGKDGEIRSLFMEPTNLYYAGIYEPPAGMTVYGGKTGVTNAAGNCLIIYSENSSGKGFITEIFNASSKDVLYGEMNELLKMCR
ncbi:MAG: serine hydrolase [Lachnospiraceae bacterium]|nr:serine hydrolase [Lachnospiraceae bacterium]